MSRLPEPGDRAAARLELAAMLHDVEAPLPDDALLLCCVGRQVTRKGFHWFVDNVMPLLPGDVHLWLAGDGPEAPAIRAAIERHSLQSRVRMLGRRTDREIAQLYAGADLFIMPNIRVPGDMEGFGLVMVEAGACGLPSVASRLEGILDVIADGCNGVLVESGDAQAFASAIERFRADRAFLASMSARTASFTREKFGWRKAAEKYSMELGLR